MPIPIVDSHIHLFPNSHLLSLACNLIHPIISDSTKPLYLRGFIFIETDRISSVEESSPGWQHVLDEVALLARIVRGEPIDGDQHRYVDRPPCLGIALGSGARWCCLIGEIRGVRYLVQDKPSGVMLQPEFIDGLKWLGRKQLTFDLGVDARQGGLWQLREAVEMMERVYEGVDEKDQVVMVINYLCKPNLRLPFASPESTTTHRGFLEWKTLVTAMVRYPKAYMKLSGGFSELPSLSPAPEPDIKFLVERLHPWTDAVFDAFGPDRVMFGSDWPVCNLGGGGNDATWRRWRTVVEGILERRGLSEEQRLGVWGKVALKAYGIEIEGL
ncbi:hypothetical protein SI65_07601 [Aspergillus cristatus]|uniref:Amidohydrolase-related domain-containing protein n=1 Tax=Aspergillus cristatus TaxID=573508 RepID=A0A1E3B8A8_ASPCR|nr:hypothetical protein SI65_07601 [Aspergillus cristatus]